jgi:hypothetical protein
MSLDRCRDGKTEQADTDDPLGVISDMVDFLIGVVDPLTLTRLTNPSEGIAFLCLLV